MDSDVMKYVQEMHHISVWGHSSIATGYSILDQSSNLHHIFQTTEIIGATCDTDVMNHGTQQSYHPLPTIFLTLTMEGGFSLDRPVLETSSSSSRPQASSTSESTNIT